MTFLFTGQLFELLSTRHPYLDPGSGSVLIQLLVAGLLAGGILLRAFWSRIVKVFKRGRNKQDDESADE